MKGHLSPSLVGVLASASLLLAGLLAGGCMATPTSVATAGSASVSDRQLAPPLAAGASRRGVPEATAAVAAWLAFESGSRVFEREQVPAGTAEMAVPAAAPTAAPSVAPDAGLISSVPMEAPALAAPTAPVAPADGPLVAAGVGGTDNADGTVTLTVNRDGTRAEGPYTETLTLTYQKATRRPVTYRHRLSVTQDGRTLVSQSRSKVWQPDGRFTESVSLSGYDQVAPPQAAPWRMDATTQGGRDGQETTIGTLRRSDGSTLTIRRTRTAGQTTLEITDSRQNLKLSGRADHAAEVKALTILIDGEPNGSVDLPVTR